MGIDDILGTAKDALDGHEDAASSALAKAGESVKASTDLPDGVVDQVVAKGQEFLENQKD